MSKTIAKGKRGRELIADVRKAVEMRKAEIEIPVDLMSRLTDPDRWRPTSKKQVETVVGLLSTLPETEMPDVRTRAVAFLRGRERQSARSPGVQPSAEQIEQAIVDAVIRDTNRIIEQLSRLPAERQARLREELISKLQTPSA